MNGITVVIPTHPGRPRKLLDRALESVWTQTCPADAVIVSVDNERRGAGWTRQQGLDASRTTYTAFLDSDDEMLPDHLDVLYRTISSDPDIIMAYSWFEAVGMNDPLGHFGLPFDVARPHHTTVTTMVNTDAARSCGGFPTAGEGSTPGCANDDWIFLLRMCDHAKTGRGKIVHVPQRTWRYHGHGGNTSGKAGMGDAH